MKTSNKIWSTVTGDSVVLRIGDPFLAILVSFDMKTDTKFHRPPDPGGRGLAFPIAAWANCL